MAKGSSKSRRESSCKTRGGIMTNRVIKELDIKLEEISDLKKTIQQLWLCLQKDYTYDEAQIHMQAYINGMTTERKVVVVEKTSNHN